MTLANRADLLLKAKRPLAALSDCDEALKINPDSAKALRSVTHSLTSISHSVTQSCPCPCPALSYLHTIEMFSSGPSYLGFFMR
jgi:hypothetical protein